MLALSPRLVDVDTVAALRRAPVSVACGRPPWRLNQ